jgi:hypothetical protein
MPGMHGYVPGGDVPDSDADPRIVAARRLLAARSEWGITCIRSVLAAFGYLGVGVGVLDDITNGSTGPIATAMEVIGIALVAFALVALVISAGETIRLRRLDQDIRTQATSEAKAASQPSRRRRRASAPGRPASWQFRVFIGSLLALWLLVMTGFMPQQVNAIAYLAGSGPTVPFGAQSYIQNCGARGGCTTMTDGVLLTDPGVRATWPEQAPLHRQFAVRRPVLASWGSPVQLMDGTWAGLSLAFGLFLDLISAGVITGLIYSWRHRRRRHQDTVAQVYASAG